MLVFLDSATRTDVIAAHSSPVGVRRENVIAAVTAAFDGDDVKMDLLDAANSLLATVTFAKWTVSLDTPRKFCTTGAVKNFVVVKAGTPSTALFRTSFSTPIFHCPIGAISGEITVTGDIAATLPLQSAVITFYANDTLDTVPSVPPSGPVIAPLGERRILLHGAELARLQGTLASTPGVRWTTSVQRQIAGSQNIYGYQAWHSAAYGVLVDNAAARADAVARIETVVQAEEALIASGKAAGVSFDSYLYIGERIGSLALVYDWCRAEMTEGQRTRWRAYADQAVWNVWNHTQATWGGKPFAWTGWSVNNPRNNYYYSFLRATMLWGLAATGESVYADECLTIFRTTKIQNQLVPSFADFDGGSQEGTGYGFALRTLFELYDWWEKSTGENIADLTGHTRATLDWTMHHVAPRADYIAPVGDQSRESSGAFFDYHREQLLILASLYPAVAGQVRTLLERSTKPQMGQGFLYFSDFAYQITSPAEPISLPTMWRGETTGALCARSGWGADASYIQAQAGPYREVHAHRDQGSVVLNYKGWLLADANTFTHSGIDQREGLRNEPTVEVGGVPLKQSLNTTALLESLTDDGQTVRANINTLPSYAGRTQILEIRRKVVYDRRGVLILADKVRVSAGTKMLNFSTLQQPSQVGNKLVLTNSLSSADMWIFGSDTPTLSEWKNFAADFERGWRIRAEMLGDDAITVIGITGVVASIQEAPFKVFLTDGSTLTL